MNSHIKMMLESHRRCAAAIQDAANDARTAANASAEETKEFEQIAHEAFELWGGLLIFVHAVDFDLVEIRAASKGGDTSALQTFN